MTFRLSFQAAFLPTGRKCDFSEARRSPVGASRLSGLLNWVLCWGGLAGALTSAEALSAQWFWSATPPVRQVGELSVAEFPQLKKVELKESVTPGGPLQTVQGYRVSQWVELKFEKEKWTAEQKAAVDLIVFRDRSGKRVPISRVLLTKYPFLLSPEKGSFRLIVPTQSQPRIRTEGIPVEAMRLDAVEAVDLAHFKAEFERFFLTKRTDPVALRGEKLALQNCQICHQESLTSPALAAGGWSHLMKPEVLSKFLGGHPGNSVQAQLTEKERKSVVSYFNLYRGQLETPSAQR